MPLQNRVTPLGDPIADPARGLVYGNRGCMHDEHKRIRRPYGVRRWIACRLEFRGWHRSPMMQPGKFTELFFLDEATAFAAGHRPCALCRRGDFARFVQIWQGSYAGEMRADPIDARLHAERFDVATRTQRHHDAPFDSLPDGAFVLRGDRAPFLVLGDRLLRWTPAGYDSAETRPPKGRAEVITPPSLVEVLNAERAPVVPFLHPSAFPAVSRRGGRGGS